MSDMFLGIPRETIDSHLTVLHEHFKQSGKPPSLYGDLVVALLWGLRDVPVNALKTRLAANLGDDHARQISLLMLDWHEEPVETSRLITERAAQSESLRQALNALIRHYGEFKENAVQLESITVNGDISGAIVNIGGSQVFWGDVTIEQHLPNVTACPTAPTPPASFTGRRQEMESLRTLLLEQPAGRIIGVHGMGGMGKTAMMKHFCHLPGSPFEVVLWAEVTSAPRPALLLETWARYASSHYKLPENNPALEGVADQVRGLLSGLFEDTCGGRVLVVLDDVWQESVETVRLLLRAVPEGAHLLLTTRQQQVIQSLGGVALPLNILDNDDSAALLKKLTTGQNLQPLSEAELARAMDILDGHPLALELAAAALNLAGSLPQRGEILDEYERGIGEFDRFAQIASRLELTEASSLRVVFARSYRGMSTAAQRRFCLLGLLPPESVWDEALAQAVWGENAWVTPLLHAALVQPAEDESTPDHPWYRQHPLLRSFARELLLQDFHAAVDSAFESFGSYLLANINTILWQKLEVLDMSYGRCVPHIETAGDYYSDRYQKGLTESDAKRLLKFIYEMHPLLRVRPEMGRLVWLESSLQAARQTGDRQMEALLLNRLALNLLSSQKSQALEYSRQALEIARDIGDTGEEIASLSNSGMIYNIMGERTKALPFYLEALDAARKTGAVTQQVSILTNLAEYYYTSNMYDTALGYINELLPILREDGGSVELVVNLTMRALILITTGEVQAGLEHFEEALEISKRSPLPDTQALVLVNFGRGCMDLGMYDQARARFEQARPIIERIRHADLLLSLENNTALLAQAYGDFEGSITAFENALKTARELHSNLFIPTLLINLGRTYWQLARMTSNPQPLLQRSRDILTEALDLCRQYSLSTQEASSLYHLAQVCLIEEDFDQALDYQIQSLNILQAIHESSLIPDVLLSIGYVQYSQGRTAEGVEVLEDGIERLKEFGHPDKMSLLYQSLARLYYAQDRLEDALAACRTAVAAQPDVTRSAAVIPALNDLGMMYYAEGRLDEALTWLNQVIQHPLADNVMRIAAVSNLSLVYLLKNDLQSAADYARQVQELLRTDDHPMRNFLNMISSRILEVTSLEAVEQFFINQMPDLAEAVFMVRTSLPGKLLDVLLDLKNHRTIYRSGSDEHALAEAMVALVLDKPVTMPPNNRYASMIAHIQEDLAYFKANNGTVRIPLTHIRELLNIVDRGLKVPDFRDEAAAILQTFEERSRQRGKLFAPDAEFVRALLLLLNHERVMLAADHPYYSLLQNLYESLDNPAQQRIQADMPSQVIAASQPVPPAVDENAILNLPPSIPAQAAPAPEAAPVSPPPAAAKPAPEVAVLRKRIEIAFADLNFESVMAHLDAVLKLQTDDAALYVFRALVLHNAGKLEPALADFDRALSLQPDNSSTHHLRAILALRLKRYDEATNGLQKAISLTDKPENQIYGHLWLWMTGLVTGAYDQVDSSRETLRQMLAVLDDSGRQRVLALRALVQKSPAVARGYLKEVLKAPRPTLFPMYFYVRQMAAVLDEPELRQIQDWFEAELKVRQPA